MLLLCHVKSVKPLPLHLLKIDNVNNFLFKEQQQKCVNTRDVRNELLICYLEISNFKLAQKCSFHAIEVLVPQSLEMQSFSRCIHFLKVSRYTDLGTVRYRP